MKPSKNELTKAQQEEVEATLFSSLQSLGLNTKNIKNFFNCIRIVQKNQQEVLINTVDGGVDEYPIYKTAIVGEWRDYSFIDENKLRKARERWDENLLRMGILSKTHLLEGTLMLLNLQKKDDDPALIKIRDHKAILTHKKYKAARECIRRSTLQILLCGKQIEETHLQRFQNSTIPFWRKQLETFRVELHLAGKATYTEEIQHADLFIKILENKNL